MMYRKPRFLELLQEIREEMSRECDYDMELFAQRFGNGKATAEKPASQKSQPAAATRRTGSKSKAKARRKP
ncbi:MAG: hypothetical protein HY650_04880 [Acidobacteria bacterium]|nr:hypothetical protein [Acidobacteriota bacterium]